MEQKCPVCGTIFMPHAKHQKYCSRKCRDHSRFLDGDRKRERDNRKIVELYDSDYTQDEISKIVGRSPDYIRKVWISAGLGNRQANRLTAKQREIKSLREKGLCSSEIAEITGARISYINHTAELVGMPFTAEEKEKSKVMGREKMATKLFGDNEERDERRRRQVSEKHPGWTWVSGFVGASDKVKIQCDFCKNIIERSAITIRSKDKIVCPTCAAAERQRQQEEKEQQRLQKEREREQRFWEQDFTQSALSFRICPQCGAPHLRTNALCCSDECSRKRANSKGDRRIRRMHKIDKSITLKKLYMRDGGKCWICGDKCDFNDCERDANGNFIVGITYPSIDHVYPISKGGQHSWDNVRLAHHYCNTLKNDKVVV